MTERICSVEGCTRKSYAKGMCRACYDKAWYEANKAQVLARTSRYQKEHPEASRAKTRRWREKNREAARAAERERYAANAAAMRARKAAWREANIEKVRAREREIAAEHPERAAVKNHRRRGEGADLTVTEWAEILKDSGGACYYCGRSDLTLEMDHKTPFPRGGRHTASNVVPACMPCNRSKGGKTAEEYLLGLKQKEAP